MKSTTMKEIRIEIPEGKEAKWMNGVLTLVDEKPKDITERVKTFEDACEALGDKHPFVEAYNELFMDNGKENKCDLPMWKDLFAYLKLRIIVAALNEGWEPKFEKDEYRYFPWFYLYTKKQYDMFGDEKKGRCVLRSGNHANSYYGFMEAHASGEVSNSNAGSGSWLALRTRELAEYAGRQFIKEWADFLFKTE